MTNASRDGLHEEMAKWARDRALRDREERQAALCASLNDIYEGYYPEEEL
mgnify:CR=1 FL=1